MSTVCTVCDSAALTSRIHKQHSDFYFLLIFYEYLLHTSIDILVATNIKSGENWILNSLAFDDIFQDVH